MLYHHGQNDYATAAADASGRARAKMGQIMEAGRATANRTIATVMSEVPSDALVRSRAIEVRTTESGLVLGTKGAQGGTFGGFSKHAINQLCSKTGMPGGYLNDLVSEGGWGRELAAKNLNELLQHGGEERVLVRSVGDQVRGVLSDSYKRLDSRPLVEAFCGAAQTAGLVPVEGRATETQVALKAMLPIVFEPAPNEVLCFGLRWSNSDFGAGAHSVNVFMLRLWCTNYAITERAMRHVHLGKQLDDVSFSAKTHALEAKTYASALGDIVRDALSPRRVEAYCAVITEAATQTIDAGKELDKLKNALTKGERRLVANAFNSPDVEMMPAGNTLWRLSNAISWCAQAEDVAGDRRMEMEKIAGSVLPEVRLAS